MKEDEGVGQMMSQYGSDNEVLLPITALEGKKVSLRMDSALRACVL